MSTEITSKRDLASFRWNNTLSEDDYLFVTYRIDSLLDGEMTALGIAKEQSTVTLTIRNIDLPPDMDDYMARIRAIRHLGPGEIRVPPYFLNTTVYTTRKAASRPERFDIEIAYPLSIFGTRVNLIWNTIFGEIPRLGFISGFQLVDVCFPPSLLKQLPGPTWGIQGIRGKLGVGDRPLFCRSMRPAVGLDTDTMLKINREVLRGGFDAIKDDELTYNNRRSPFRERVRRMVEMKREVEQQTGRKKLYFANVIDDYLETIRLAEEAAELGADGVLVSYGAQGLSVITDVARKTGLLIISHNSCADFLTRHPSWGVNDKVMAQLQRLCGGDFLMTPGDTASDYESRDTSQGFMEASREPLHDVKPAMPVLMGGKTPDDIEKCRSSVGSDDFMVIAASWLDSHEEGIAAAAAAYIKAV